MARVAKFLKETWVMSFFLITFVGVWIYVALAEGVYAGGVEVALQVFLLYALYFAFLHSLSTKLDEFGSKDVLSAILIYVIFTMLLVILFASVWLKVKLRLGADQKNPSLIDAIYFSVVTFSTIGFGDVVPANNLGKLLLIAEAMLGTTHAAVFIAILFSKLKKS